MKTILWGLYYWPIFLMAVSIGFAIPEGIALATNHKNTLSDYSWGELHVINGEHLLMHNLAWWGSLVAWIFFISIITPHIWFKVLS